MKLKELLEWINGLPPEFLEFTVVNAEQGDLTEDGLTYRLDKPVVSLNVDEENKEILLLNLPYEEPVK